METEVGSATEPELEPGPDGYVCGPCQRGKHHHCRSPECACCLGNPDE